MDREDCKKKEAHVNPRVSHYMYMVCSIHGVSMGLTATACYAH